MKTTRINCLNCGCETNVPVREVKRGNGKFCSLKCSSLYRGKRTPKPDPNVACAHCGKRFYKSKSKMTQSKSGLFFCCREHKDLAQRFDGIDEINLPHYGNGQWCYRVMALRKKGSVCERCGYGKHVAAITVHHKDRDRTNNAMDNLEVLCANCHAIEHHG